MKKKLIYSLFLIPYLVNNSYDNRIEQKEIDEFIRDNYGLESLIEKFPENGTAMVIFEDKSNRLCVSIKNKKVTNNCIETSDFVLITSEKYSHKFRNENLCDVISEIKKNKDYRFKKNISILESFFKYFKVLFSKEARYYKKCADKQ